jgi:hypothetical protein
MTTECEWLSTNRYAVGSSPTFHRKVIVAKW